MAWRLEIKIRLTLSTVSSPRTGVYPGFTDSGLQQKGLYIWASFDQSLSVVKCCLLRGIRSASELRI
jgi:hypothetical protein